MNKKVANDVFIGRLKNLSEHYEKGEISSSQKLVLQILAIVENYRHINDKEMTFQDVLKEILQR